MPGVRLVVRNYVRNGLTVSFELVAVDANGVVDTAWTGTVAFAATNSTIPGLPASYTFTANDRGARTFSTTIQTIDNVRITATDSGGTLAAAGINIGGNGPDSFTGGAGGDAFDAGGDFNTLIGGAGEDGFYVNTGANTITGGGDNDRLIIDWTGGSLTNSTPLTGSLASGYSGAFGGNFASFSGIENFTIRSNNNSADTIITGDGEDEYVQAALDDRFYIRDVIDLGGGVDRILFDARGNTGNGVSLVALGFNGTGEMAVGGNGKLGFTNVERLTLLGSQTIDDLRGLDFADRLDGNGGADRITGNGGNDDLRGGAGADVIEGDGRATILLLADNQNDAGAGVSDNDFRVTANYAAANPFEADLFTGVTVGTVRMRVRGVDVEAGETADVYVNDTLVGTLGQYANNLPGDTIFTFDSALVAGGVARVRIQNSGAAADGFSIQDVELTLEKQGDDRIDGGTGVDQMAGGRGNDTYVADDARDSVQEAANAGTDTVLAGGSGFTLGANVENLVSTLSSIGRVPTVETFVNNLVTGAGQFPQQIVGLPDGGYVILFSDQNNGFDTRARFFNADGSPRGDEFLVNASTAGNQGQFGMSAVTLDNGNILVAFFNTPDSSANERITGRIFNANGVAQGGEFTLADTAGTFDSYPTMARLNSGQIALVYQNGAADGSGTFSIGYRLLNADGTPTAAAPVIFNTTTAGDQYEPVMTRLDDGRLVAAWESREPGGDVVRARVINADGTVTTPDFVVGIGGDILRTAITSLVGGGFTVAWESNNYPYARVYGADALPVGGQFAVTSIPQSSEISGVTRLAEGGFMATWAMNGDGSNFAVWGRLFNADGSPRGDDFIVNQLTTAFQNSPRVGTLADGRVVVAFGSEAPGSVAYDVKQVIVDTTPNQTLTGNEGANAVTGGRGDDTIAGSGGGDTLTGNQGADYLFGENWAGTGANLIVNGGFETVNGSNVTRDVVLSQNGQTAPGPSSGTFDGVAYTGTTTLFGWGIGNGTRVELNTNNGSAFYTTAEGTSNINFEYLGGENLVLFQDITGLAGGERYVLRFAANLFASSDSYTGTLQVVWNGQILETITPETKTPGYYTYIVQAAATGTGTGGANRLEFREIGSPDGIGTTLDDVSLKALAPANDMGVGALGPNLITNGSFEQRDATTTSNDWIALSPSNDFNGGDPQYRVGNQLLGWGFLRGTTQVELQRDNPADPRLELPVADGLVSLDFEVGLNERTGIFQDVAGLVDGQRYRITLSAQQWTGSRGEPSAGVQVIWNGRVVGTVIPTSLTPADYSFDVIAQAGAANRVAFQAIGGGNARGVGLDNIRLNQVNAADSAADTVDYAREGGSGGVVVNLSATSQTVGGTAFAAGTARDSYGTVDRLFGIENVVTGAGADTVYGDDGANVITTGAGADTVFGGGGGDVFNVNVTTDGGDTVNLGDGADRVLLSGAAGQVRLTFTSAGVGNGSANDTNGDAGLNVRMQAEDGADGVTGALSRYDDEGITFIAGAGQTFDVRDFVSGAQRGDAFGRVDLGTAGDDTIVFTAPASTVNLYVNGGGGADTITTAAGNDFLVGGAGADTLSGLAGADTLLGGDGDDALTGGTGNDALVGGIGTDRALVADAVTLAALSLLTDADPTAAGDQPGWRLTGATDGIDSLSGVEIVDGSEAGRILLVGAGGFADEAAALAASTSTNDQILFAGDRSAAAVEDTPLALGTRDFGFVDRDGVSSVGVRIVTLPPAGQGTLLLNGVAVSANQVIAASAILAGNLTYAPALNVNGAASFTFQLTDPGTGVSSAQTNTLTLNVAAVNDAPTVAAPAGATLLEDGSFAFSGSNTISVADVDVGAGTVRVTLGIADGTLTLGTTTGLTVTGGGAALTITGTLADVNAGLATLTYTPPANANGARTLSIAVDDLGNTGSGGALTATRSVPITITPVNDAPVFTATGAQPSYTEKNPAVAVASGVSLSDIDNLNFNGGTLTVVFTANVVAGDALTFPNVAGPGVYVDTASGAVFVANVQIGTAQPVAGGARVTFNANATPTAVVELAQAVGYVTTSRNPTNATREITFTLVDGGGTVNNGADTASFVRTVSVVPVDDAPEPSNDTATVAENATVAIDVLTGDFDVDGGPKSVATIAGTTAQVGTPITLSSGATATLNANGTITYNPMGKFDSLISASKAAQTGAANSTATDSFAYTTNGGGTATVTVTITGVDGANDRLEGSAGNNSFTGTAGSDLFMFQAGGEDTANGGDGNDGAYMGAALSPGDTIALGAGAADQLGLQGNYGTFGGSAAPYTFSASNLRVQAANAGTEQLILFSGSDNRFVNSGGALFSYNLALVDANIDTGQLLLVNFNQLQVGENVRLDASAELGGGILTYAGLGGETVIGTQGDDGFYHGAQGRFGADSIYDGQGGNNQVGFQGLYTAAANSALVFTETQFTNIQGFVFLSGGVTRFGSGGQPYAYEVTWKDGNFTTGTVLIQANTLLADERLNFNGAAETTGSFNIFSGAGNDVIVGGALADKVNAMGGNNTITGGGGADELTANGGINTYRYLATTDSGPNAADKLLAFKAGTDKIDLSEIDAITTNAAGTNDSFTFVGSDAFSAGGLAAGKLRAFQTSANGWTIEGDTNGDGVADIVILVTTTTVTPISAGDFLP